MPTEEELKNEVGEAGVVNSQGVDPMYPDEPEQETPKPIEEAPKSVASAISQRLESADRGEEVGKEEGARAESPIPFDITKMSREQIQSLKQMLASTPDTQTRKKQNPTTALRRIDGKFVEDFKRAYNGLVDDPENNRKVERHIIPIKFFGETEYKAIRYADFINSERVSCEITATRTHTDEIIEGETISRETGMPVEVIRKDIIAWYTVKLPDGSLVEIKGTVSNG